ncbi:MAG: single-stranded DNA-binding protein [Acidimicrobiales bacterium]
MPDNAVTLVGNITRQPELRFTNSGQAVATFGLAVNRRWQNRQSGEWEESTSFFNVTCWAQLAENVASSLEKGARVLITGRLEQRSYETQQGEKRSVVDVIADEVGASLRWANVAITKNDRSGATADSAGAAAGSRPVANQDPGAPSYAHDEEPF